MPDNIPGYIYRKSAEEHLAVAGYNDPVSLVSQLYEEHLPTDDQYNHEIEQFRPHYRSVMEKAAYLEIIEELAGTDAVQYKDLYEQGRTPEGRLANGGDVYKEAIARIPEYKPAGREDFLFRFDDLPEHIHEVVYKQAVEMAKNNLRNLRL